MVSYNGRSVLFLVFTLFLIVSSLSVVFAIPPLPTEFYGAVYHRGSPAPVNSSISVRTDYNTTCGSSFSIVNYGYFGLITCPGDDPDTPEIEGPPDGTEITIYFNGEPTAVISGDNTTQSGSIKFLNVSHPVPYCGDYICDPFFENITTCFKDCNTNITVNNTNTTINTTGNGSGSGSGGSGSGSGSGSGGGGGGGSGSGSGGGGSGSGSGGGGSYGGVLSSLGKLYTPLSGLNYSGTSPLCEENWYCEPWGPCMPNGLQKRNCTDSNHCGTTDDKPVEVQECVYFPTCFDGVQNNGETGVDCGGPCIPCPSCSNGVQDCLLLDDGSYSCEEGIDCGGSCRPCDSCFNGVKDWTELGVDCGGVYCAPCAKTPVLLFPKFFCEKSINPLNNAGFLFFIVMIIFLLFRVLFYLKRIEMIHNNNKLDDLKRARDYYAERRKMLIFVLISFIISVIVYLFYYEFLLCELAWGQLWWLIAIILISPFIVYWFWHFMEYHDRRKLALLGVVDVEHIESMERLLAMENDQLLNLESEIRDLVEIISRDPEFHKLLSRFPELKAIYHDIIRLHDEYQRNKSPFGIEKDLCQQVYSLETNKQFVKLAEEYPDFWKLYNRLRVLYEHYERKQQVYDEISSESERLKQRLYEGLDLSGVSDIENDASDGSPDGDSGSGVGSNSGSYSN